MDGAIRLGGDAYEKAYTLAIIAMLIMAISANAWPWLSPYAYCMNNPVKFVDPDGQKVVLVYYNNSNHINTLTVRENQDLMVLLTIAKVKKKQ